MSDVKLHNKKLAKKVKKTLDGILEESISLGHAYEFISQLSGYPNWDTASAADVCLMEGKVDVELSAREKEIEKVFNFNPRTPEKLRETIHKIVFNYLEDEDEDADIIADDILECAEEGDLFGGPLFELFDSLGTYPDKDMELEYIYNLASNCWFTQTEELAHADKSPASNVLTKLLASTIHCGFNKEEHYALLAKNNS